MHFYEIWAEQIFLRNYGQQVLDFNCQSVETQPFFPFSVSVLFRCRAEMRSLETTLSSAILSTSVCIFWSGLVSRMARDVFRGCGRKAYIQSKHFWFYGGLGISQKSSLCLHPCLRTVARQQSAFFIFSLLSCSGYVPIMILVFTQALITCLRFFTWDTVGCGCLYLKSVHTYVRVDMSWVVLVISCFLDYSCFYYFLPGFFDGGSDTELWDGWAFTENRIFFEYLLPGYEILSPSSHTL